MFCFIFAMRRANRINHETTRVKLFSNPLNDSAFACRIPPFEDQHYRPLLLINLQAQFAHLNLAPSELPNVLFPVKFAS